jgi:acetyltransferase
VSQAETKDGAPIIVRPIRPEDEPLMVRFHESLSERSVYMRYFHAMNLTRRTAHERLTRICFIDYDREMALVAEGTNPETGEPEILGVARLSRHHSVLSEAEFSILVNDDFQLQGVGTVLMEKILEVARDEGLHRLIAEILPENRAMQRLSRKFGFNLHRDVTGGVVRADLDLYQMA